MKKIIIKIGTAVLALALCLCIIGCSKEEERRLRDNMQQDISNIHMM
jgi:uncharacterized lipoprotein YehR (DUF1307 family)